MMKSRLLDATSGGKRLVILPVDHGLALGEVSGLEDPVDVAATFAKETAIDGTLCSAPVARRLAAAGFPESALRIVTLDSALQGGDGRILQVPVCPVSVAKDAGCDGVKVLMGWDADLAARGAVLTLVADAVHSGHEHGLAVIAEPVSAGAIERVEPGELERREIEAARIAIEVGADIIKMKIWPTTRFERFVQHCPVPVVALGGGLSGQRTDVFDSIKRGLDMGLTGVFVGRNVWQRPRPEALELMQEVCDLVHVGSTGA
jgi:DhnA family fructose-bisphosphate aldolase class Ia